MTTALAASILSTTLSQAGGGSFRESLTDGTSDGQSSLAFICTVCSAMMGSTLMTLPWAFERAGLLASLLMIVLVGAVSYYTCYIILGWGAPPNGNFTDFSYLCSHYLGDWAKHVANGTAVSVCVGVCAVYHTLMASSLQGIILDIGELANVDPSFLCCGSGYFKYAVTSIAVGVCVFPLTCFRTIDRLMTLGSYGGISVLYNSVFIVGNALVEFPDAEMRSSHKVKYVGTPKDFGVFIGTLGLSLFVHSLLLQMSSAHRSSVAKPFVVKRDVGIAYLLAVVFYIIVGALPAVAFQLGGKQYKYAKDGALPQNILLAYDRGSWGAIIGQTLLVLQIMIVYPLIMTVVRGQFFSSVLGTVWPGWTKAILFSVFTVTFTTTVTAVFPHPGTVVGYVGVYTAIVYMCGLPILVHLKASKLANKSSLLSSVVHLSLFVCVTFAFLSQFFF